MGKITYTYSAQNREGLPVKGVVEAADKEDALNKLRLLQAEGLQNINIENAVVEKDAEPSGSAQEAPAQSPLLPKIASLTALICALALAAGMLRVYYGKKFGMKIAWKQSFSFDHIIVNVDRLSELPNSVLKEKYPEVRKELQKMGVLTQEEKETQRLMKNIRKKAGTNAGQIEPPAAPSDPG